MQIFDETRCELGEGVFWHPERGQVFWFDITRKRLHTRTAEGHRSWEFPEMISAGGWIDHDHLLIASETGLWRFDLRDGSHERLVPIEADDDRTRSNDGGPDPWGGFWLGTMGKKGETGLGTLYRWYRNELRVLRTKMNIPNAIAFDADRSLAYVSDTPTHTVWAYTLDKDGWPEGESRVFLDLSDEGLRPDGGTVDSEGRFWSAPWGLGRVAVYRPAGQFITAEEVPAARSSRPAFGGPDLTTLFVTTAQEGMDAAARRDEPKAGMTFHGSVTVQGRPAVGVPTPRVVIG
ncbi:SMP-30/gluconolactonase/LRE family protein [Falsirhodobacter deserti]|uniref:SMP-30/gluconolactonase/LRE family protein n=1 Tax=Falsirhodobacter deserti TaxID=1365611 RepID=UPI000FE317AF|nr:SMP-30/gluconolactonase/LRE family protein [Falsirhodobacter deserti]